MDPAPEWQADPTDQQDAFFGSQVAGAGDVNGDGYADIIVGAPYWSSNNAVAEGRAYVYLGSSQGLSTTPGWSADPTDASNAHFGTSVAGAGDVNGDGYDDVIVGADAWAGFDGRAFAYLGGPAGLELEPVWDVEPDESFSYFGSEVAGLGDVSGDGNADVVVGAWYWSGDTLAEGRAWVFLSNNGSLTTSASWSADPTDLEYAFFGFSVAGAGDVNGDGCGDLVVGSFGWEAPGSNENGRAYVFQGCCGATGFAP